MGTSNIMQGGGGVIRPVALCYGATGIKENHSNERNKQYFPVIQFVTLYKLVDFESVTMQKNESYQAVLSYSTVSF